MRLTIELPWKRPPLSLNDRKHWTAQHRIKTSLRNEAAVLTRQARGFDPEPFELPLDITLVWRVTDRRRRDTDNPFATLKPCIDGITDALGIDDHAGNVSSRCVIEYRPGESPGLRLDVRDAAEPKYERGTDA